MTNSKVKDCIGGYTIMLRPLTSQILTLQLMGLWIFWNTKMDAWPNPSLPSVTNHPTGRSLYPANDSSKTEADVGSTAMAPASSLAHCNCAQAEKDKSSEMNKVDPYPAMGPRGWVCIGPWYVSCPFLVSRTTSGR